jgi:hypothetical protein
MIFLATGRTRYFTRTVIAVTYDIDDDLHLHRLIGVVTLRQQFEKKFRNAAESGWHGRCDRGRLHVVSLRRMAEFAQ